MYILKKLYFLMLQRIRPMAYAKAIGVDIAEDVRLIGRTQYEL